MKTGSRLPERLFRLSMWIVSFVFAGFLIGLGGKVIADLPRLDRMPSIEDFADRDALDRIREALRADEPVRERLVEQAEQRRLERNTAQAAFNSERQAFENWVATRRSTQNPAQDAELTARTRKLDDLKALEQEAAAGLARADREMLEIDQRVRALQAERARIIDLARDPYQSAMRWQELTVFGVRLAFTLPLLLVAGYLVARKRRSEYWPLARGFVIAALFAFFVELVPYLPSYGGYVRYAVGILLTGLAGHYAIRWMRGYLARRREEEKKAESDRRRTISYESALKNLAANVCPGCERQVAAKGEKAPDFCMHCGMKLFGACGSCGTRRNAFFRYCSSCGDGDGGKTAPPGAGAQPQSA